MRLCVKAGTTSFSSCRERTSYILGLLTHGRNLVGPKGIERLSTWRFLIFSLTVPWSFACSLGSRLFYTHSRGFSCFPPKSQRSVFLVASWYLTPKSRPPGVGVSFLAAEQLLPRCVSQGSAQRGLRRSPTHHSITLPAAAPRLNSR